MKQWSIEDFVRNFICIDTASPSGLRWVGHPNKAASTMRAGKPAGSMNKYGCFCTEIMGRSMRNHRLVWFLAHGLWPKGDIDHIDGNRVNNHPDNLRDISRAENGQNTIALGYSWEESRKKWRASISVEGRPILIGRFKTEKEARHAYLKAKKKLHPTAPERCFPNE